MELTLYMAHAGNHIGHTLEEKPGLILKNIMILEDITVYRNMYNTTTKGSTGEHM